MANSALIVVRLAFKVLNEMIFVLAVKFWSKQLYKGIVPTFRNLVLTTGLSVTGTGFKMVFDQSPFLATTCQLDYSLLRPVHHGMTTNL